MPQNARRFTPALDAVVEASLSAAEIYANNIHHAPEQSLYLLNLLKKAGYAGFVVSEAKEAYQIKDEFNGLYDFFRRWKEGGIYIMTKISLAIGKYRFFFIGAIICFYVFSITLSFNGLPAYQWLTIVGIFLFSSIAYWLIGRQSMKNIRLKVLAVFLLYFFISLLIFSPTIWSVFRSDYWLISKLFNSIDVFTLESFKKISFFEMFGDARFQPFAHLMMFARHLLFGNEVVLYNLLNICLHSVVAFLIFLSLLAFLKDIRFSFMIGLFFIALPTQFDTVVWTYHIYIIAGTILVLSSILLTWCYVESESVYQFAIAVILAVISIFLYEAAIAAPVALIFLFFGMHVYNGKKNHSRDYLPIVVWIIFAYILYVTVTVYGFTLIKAGNKIVFTKDILWNLLKTVAALAKNFLETIFLKNIGVIYIESDGTVLLPRRIMSDVVAVAKIAIGVFLLAHLRFTKKNRYIVLVLAVIATSYLFVIFWGRSFTNGLEYMVSQPRYQYFANAVFLITVGVLLWQKYQEKHLKALITAFFAVIFLWNVQTVFNGGNKIAMAMQPLDAHYYRIKGFLKIHPSLKIFLDFIPETYSQFALGSDIALDDLFTSNITKSLKKAAYIYDGISFRSNDTYMKEITNPYLKDFTVSWMYYYSKETPPTREIGIVGSDKIYPGISITPDGFVKVTMINTETGNMETFRMKHGYSREYAHPVIGPWASFVVEKNNHALCLIVNGIVQDKIILVAPYADWNKDDVDIIGSFYEGAKAMAMVGRLFIQTDAAKYGCANYGKGDTIGVDFKKPW